MKNSYFILGFIIQLIFPFVTYAQSEKALIKGIVIDSVSLPLEAANIVIEINDSSKSVLFGKTDHFGKFSIEVPKKTEIQINISYLGFQKYSKQVIIDENDVDLTVKLGGSIPIEEVVIKYQYQPIIIKKDTIVFDAKAFMDGSERKLQDVLSKLPGVTIKNGQVQFQGNAITNTKVENRPFFGGNTRLAIENIPSEAISKIEMISHFSEVDFMKEVLASDDMAMNVTLKETHKNLLFGDLEASAGTNKSFNTHGALFSYTPERNMQFIGDWNNTGKALFSLSDFVQLQGGTKNFANRSPIATQGLLGLTEVNRQHKSINQQFAAANFQKSWKDKWDLSLFAIVNRIKSEDYSENQIDYLLLEGDNRENRNTSLKPDNLMGWLNLRLDYKPSNFEVLNYRMGLQTGRQLGNMYYSSKLTNNVSESIITNKTLPFNLQNIIEWNKKISPKKIIESSLRFNVQKQPLNRYLGMDDFYFKELIPLSNINYYHFFQQKKQESIGGDFHLQYYYTINRYHQLSPILKFHINQSTIKDNYELKDEIDNSYNLDQFGFGNNLTYRQIDMLLGFQYKLDWKELTAKFLIAGNYVDHRLEQIYGQGSANSIIFTPKINLDYKFSNVKRTGLAYEYSFSYPTLRYIDGGFELVSFNTIYRGLPDLSTERFHTVSANFRNFSLNKSNLWTFINYTRKNRSYRNTASINTQGQLLQSLILYTPENNLSLSFFSEKTWGIFTPYISLNANVSDFIQIINNEEFQTDQIGGTGKFGIRTSGKDFPSLKLSYERSINEFKGINKSTFHGEKLEIDISYLLANVWRLQSNYVFSTNRNLQQNNKLEYNIMSAEIAYQPQKKPWSILLNGQNIFNNRNTISTSLTNYLATTMTTITLPRQILLGFRYKL